MALPKEALLTAMMAGPSVSAARGVTKQQTSQDLAPCTLRPVTSQNRWTEPTLAQGVNADDDVMPLVGLHQVEHCCARLRPRRRLAPADADLHWRALLSVESSVRVPNRACPCDGRRCPRLRPRACAC